MHVLKQPTWNVGLPPFQETWILKAFFTFHTLKIKTQNTNQPFIELETFIDNGRDVCCTSMMEPIPAGMRTSRLVCSSNKYRKITIVLKHLQSTTEPEHRDQTILTTCQASKDSTVLTISRKDLYFPQAVLLTCFAGHSHHAFLLLPKADVILERQEIKEELKKKPNYNIFIITSPLNRHDYEHLSLWFDFLSRTCN